MEATKQPQKPLKQKPQINKTLKTYKINELNFKRALRGKRNGVKKYEQTLKFLGVNTAGLKSKFTSFKKVINELKPSVFFAQETKFREEGNIKLGDEYLVYEFLRKNEKGGGGLALGCQKNLNPCLVSEGNENVEALSIDIFIKNMKIRCCTAYGPQENDKIEKKEAFWDHLDKEVGEAEKSGAGFILQFDGNLWAGKKIIPNDPRPQNNNGKMFEQFLLRNPRLTVVNSLPECRGLVTRSRIKEGVKEESVLDFFVVCELILPFVKKMVIDDSKNYILSNYKIAKQTGKAVDSDHFTQYLDLNLKIGKERPERKEMFNFKDKNCQEAFKINTSETEDFTDCFNGEAPLNEKINNWKRVLMSHCSKAFKKIRIRDRKIKPISNKIARLIDKRNELTRIGCVCGKAFGLKTHAKKHSEKHIEKAKFVCYNCGKQLETKNNLQLHVKTHTGLKDYHCDKCDSRYMSSVDLTVHEKSKHGCLSCDVCEQNFQKNYDRKKHVTKHKKETCFQCKECGKIFIHYRRYKNHVRVHKGIDFDRCSLCEKELISINIAISEEEASENREKIVKQFQMFSENPESIQMTKMWKILKNICPKVKPILPSAKKNHRGKILSSKKDIKMLLAKEYKNRLRSRPFRPDLIDQKIRRQYLFKLKLKQAEANKSIPWTMKELEHSLKDLKRNKSMDSEGFINEIFKNDVIGTNLKKSLLLMFNKLKQENMISQFMNHANITTVPKKGPKLELKNQRGIFRVSVIRSILMRLIYNSKYEIIDQNIWEEEKGRVAETTFGLLMA